MFWHAVNATVPQGISYNELAILMKKARTDVGAAGLAMEWQTEFGAIRGDILKTGLQDSIMGYSIITKAVMRSCEAADPAFK